MHLPTRDDLADAQDRIRPYAIITPLIESDVLNERVGGRVFAKAEMFQRTGSFKFRGAYNRVSRVERDAFPGGVVACSSGNHAQGVAEAARLCDLKAKIVMPSDAPKMKIDRTRRSGADIIFYDRETEDRNAIAADLCQTLKADFVSPFDDAMVIAGQGTAGMELTNAVREKNMDIDAVLVPASGGGLTAGVAIAVQDRFAHAEIYCVEPDGFDDYAHSLASGKREQNSRRGGSICDSLLASEPGFLTFEVNKSRLSGGVTVTDAVVRDAIAFAYRELKVVVEPGGAVGLAALLSGKFNAKGRTVAILLSGGNVDPALFADIIATA